MNNLAEMISLISSLDDADRRWIIKQLSPQEKQLMMSLMSSQGAAIIPDQVVSGLLHDENSLDGDESLRYLLQRAFRVAEPETLGFLSSESAWLRVYLHARFTRIFDDTMKDEVLKNRWRNSTGMDSLQKNNMTDHCRMAIHQAMHNRLANMLADKEGVKQNGFANYMNKIA